MSQRYWNRFWVTMILAVIAAQILMWTAGCTPDPEPPVITNPVVIEPVLPTPKPPEPVVPVIPAPEPTPMPPVEEGALFFEEGDTTWSPGGWRELCEREGREAPEVRICD